jgi:hypothetical protein
MNAHFIEHIKCAFVGENNFNDTQLISVTPTQKKTRTISAVSGSRVGLLIFRLGFFSDVKFLSSLLDQ